MVKRMEKSASFPRTDAQVQAVKVRELKVEEAGRTVQNCRQKRDCSEGSN